MGQEDLPFPRDDSSDASDPLAPDRESGGTRATRELDPEFPPAVVRSTPVILRSPPNWTAIIFFLALGVLHLSFAGSSFVAGHPEGYLSLFFGTAFSTIALGCWLACCQVAVLPSDKRVRL